MATIVTIGKALKQIGIAGAQVMEAERLLSAEVFQGEIEPHIVTATLAETVIPAELLAAFTDALDRESSDEGIESLRKGQKVKATKDHSADIDGGTSGMVYKGSTGVVVKKRGSGRKKETLIRWEKSPQMHIPSPKTYVYTMFSSQSVIPIKEDADKMYEAFKIKKGDTVTFESPDGTVITGKMASHDSFRGKVNVTYKGREGYVDVIVPLASILKVNGKAVKVNEGSLVETMLKQFAEDLMQSVKEANIGKVRDFQEVNGDEYKFRVRNRHWVVVSKGVGEGAIKVTVLDGSTRKGWVDTKESQAIKNLPTILKSVSTLVKAHTENTKVSEASQENITGANVTLARKLSAAGFEYDKGEDVYSAYSEPYEVAVMPIEPYSGEYSMAAELRKDGRVVKSFDKTADGSNLNKVIDSLVKWCVRMSKQYIKGKSESVDEAFKVTFVGREVSPAELEDVAKYADQMGGCGSVDAKKNGVFVFASESDAKDFVKRIRGRGVRTAKIVKESTMRTELKLSEVSEPGSLPSPWVVKKGSKFLEANGMYVIWVSDESKATHFRSEEAATTVAKRVGGKAFEIEYAPKMPPMEAIISELVNRAVYGDELDEGELDRYLSGEYANYEYGKPEKAAEKLKKAIASVMKIIKKARQDSKIAGGFLTPGVSAAFARDLQLEILKVMQVREGIDEARGQGRGMGGSRQGDGGAASCVCPKCGYKTSHDRGTPCTGTKCPKCGAQMIGEEIEVQEAYGSVFSALDVDEIGKVWVLDGSYPDSEEMGEQVYPATIMDLMLQFKGGMRGEKLIGIFKSKRKAMAHRKKVAKEWGFDLSLREANEEDVLFTPKEINYTRTGGKPGQRCAECEYWVSGICVLTDEDVTANGVCDFFETRESATEEAVQARMAARVLQDGSLPDRIKERFDSRSSIDEVTMAGVKKKAGSLGGKNVSDSPDVLIYQFKTDPKDMAFEKWLTTNHVKHTFTGREHLITIRVADFGESEEGHRRPFDGAGESLEAERIRNADRTATDEGTTKKLAKNWTVTAHGETATLRSPDGKTYYSSYKDGEVMWHESDRPGAKEASGIPADVLKAANSYVAPLLKRAWGESAYEYTVGITCRNAKHAETVRTKMAVLDSYAAVTDGNVVEVVTRRPSKGDSAAVCHDVRQYLGEAIHASDVKPLAIRAHTEDDRPFE